MKIIIGVLGCTNSLFQLLINEGIKKTWGKHCNLDNVEVVYYFGHDNSSVVIEHDKIFFPTDDGLANVAQKSLLFYEYLNTNKTYDFLFRTNCSSYVNIQNLLNFLHNKPKQNFFSAFIGDHYGRQFASGSGFVITKDLVELIIKNKHLYDNALVDDLALSFALTDLGIKITQGRRQNFISPQQVHNEIDTTHYHYRCKSRNVVRNLQDTLVDVEIMKTIDNLLKKQE